MAVLQFGILDIVVNDAAGIMEHFAPVGELDNAMWDKVMKASAECPMKTMRSAVKIFLAKGSSNITNIASVGGLQGIRVGAAYTDCRQTCTHRFDQKYGLYVQQIRDSLQCHCVGGGKYKHQRNHRFH